jgi:hypothetical protein
MDVGMPIGEFAKKLVFSFGRAFLGAFLVLVPGILAAPNLTAGRAALLAAAIGGLTAGVRALQVFFPGVDSHA